MDKPHDDTEDSPLVAAFAGTMEFIVPFLRAGAPASYCNSFGDSLLHAAAEGWQYPMVEFLILSGANANAQNRNGDTPLHTVTRSRQVPVDGMFLSDADSLDARRKTFSALLTRRADRTVKNIQGAIPLHVAAADGDLLAIDALADLVTID